MHKSSWGKENGQQTIECVQGIAGGGEGTSKKGNPKPHRNLKGRKKNIKGKGSANGKSKKKADKVRWNTTHLLL